MGGPQQAAHQVRQLPAQLRLRRARQGGGGAQVAGGVWEHGGAQPCAKHSRVPSRRKEPTRRAERPDPRAAWLAGGRPPLSTRPRRKARPPPCCARAHQAGVLPRRRHHLWGHALLALGGVPEQLQPPAGQPRQRGVLLRAGGAAGLRRAAAAAAALGLAVARGSRCRGGAALGAAAGGRADQAARQVWQHAQPCCAAGKGCQLRLRRVPALLQSSRAGREGASTAGGSAPAAPPGAAGPRPRPRARRPIPPPSRPRLTGSVGGGPSCGRRR